MTEINKRKKNKNDKYIAAFDFDGVIWDSADECFFTSYYVFKEQEGEIPRPEEFLQSQFRKGRYLAKDGEDFYILLHLLRENPEIDFEEVNVGDFAALRKKFEKHTKPFVKKFYDKRHHLQSSDFDFWMSLQKPYPEVLKILPHIKNIFGNLVISTTKDAASVKILLGKYGQEYPVYGREISLMKSDHMRQIADDYSTDTDKIIFVDDLIENLQDAASAGAKPLMASWGYNTLKERQKADELNITRVEQENLVTTLTELCSRIR